MLLKYCDNAGSNDDGALTGNCLAGIPDFSELNGPIENVSFESADRQSSRAEKASAAEDALRSIPRDSIFSYPYGYVGVIHTDPLVAVSQSKKSLDASHADVIISESTP